MIVLDTNVLSEALRPSPAETVLRWLAAQDPVAVFITAITQAELLYEFPGRILPFDEDSARVSPKVVAHRDTVGRPISQFDAMIASICRSRGAAAATRNTSDFEHCGIPIIDPWNE